MADDPKITDPEFITRHTPVLKHYGMEWLDQSKENLESGQPPPVFQSTAPPVAKPESLIDFYLKGDVAPIFADLTQRAEHYTDRQKEIVEAMMAGKEPHPKATINELNDLMFRWREKTEQVKARREVVRRAQKADFIPEGGSFEDQDFGPTIKII